MPSLRSRLFTAASDLRFCWRSVLGFQLWYASLSLALFGPSLAWLLHRLVGASGSMAVSNYELVGFFLSVPGFLFLTVFSVVTLALVFLNNAGLVLIAGAAGQRLRVSPLRLLQQNLARFRRLLGLGGWVLLLSLIPAIPCVLGVWLIQQFLLGEADINYYLAEHPPEWVRAQWMAGSLVVLWGGLAGWFALRWSLAIQFALFTDSPPLECLRRSWRVTRNGWVSLLGVLAVWWGGLTLASLGIGALYTLLAQEALQSVGLQLGWVILVVALVSLGYLLGGWAYGVVWGGMSELLLTRFFFERVTSTGAVVSIDARMGESMRHESVFRKLAWVSVLIALGGGVLGVVGGLSRARTDHQPYVTAHRGSSGAAPENSLSALKLAMEQGADYSEIDVQRTADGQLVLMHDADFMRVAGEPFQLNKVTLRQAREFDISGRFRDEYSPERVGTLQEAIDLVQGRMKLNIELKYNHPDNELAGSVVDLVQRSEFTDQCVITSLELAPLLEIEERTPELVTGLIVTAVVGDVTRIPVDFYSLNSSRATPEFIQLVHKRGKAVHVWTINNEEQMHQMIEQGADNLITDYPDRVRELLVRRGELSPAERVALRLRNGLLYGY